MQTVSKPLLTPYNSSTKPNVQFFLTREQENYAFKEIIATTHKEHGGSSAYGYCRFECGRCYDSLMFQLPFEGLFLLWCWFPIHGYRKIRI
jgi:hypothetical protein